MVINWFLEGDFKNKFSNTKNNIYSFLFCSLFLVYLFGLLHTSNMQSGKFDIQVKLSLFAFPLLLLNSNFDKKEISKILMAFIFGCFLTSIICFFYAIYSYFALAKNIFFYESFTNIIDLHPSYFSMYLNTAIAFLLLYLLNNNNLKNKYWNILICFFILYFSFIVVLLSSKMGIITMLLLFLLFFTFYIIRNKKYFLGLTGIVTLVFLFIGVMKFVPEVKGRIQNALTAVNDSKSLANTDVESTGVRILVWRAAEDVIQEHFWFGTGTGDVKDVLMRKYKEKGLTGAYDHQLNAHNQYLETFAATGIIGFLILLANFIIPIYVSVKKNNKFFLAFMLIIILNFLTESMFDREAGVLFFAFFNSFLFFNFA